MNNYDEMNSKKSERRSRRSSILKAPKPRQPLQNLERSPSTTENSPSSSATKVRRRVSFAEKKHVKEFCDLVDQGTVWDNTYEENDSGHVNSATLKTGVSSLDVESANTLNTKDIENHETNGTECDLDLTDAVGVVEHVELASELENKKITNFHENSIVPGPEENPAFSQNSRPTQTQINTELSISTVDGMIPRNDTSEKTQVFSDNSMDFTEVVKTIETQTSPERTTIFHNVSVDFTEIVENIKNVEKPLEKTTICFDNTVDFTEIIENIPRIERNEKTIIAEPEKTIVFHDTSIDFTEIVDNIGKSRETEKSTLDKTMIFNNVFVDITEAVSNIPNFGKASSEIFQGMSSSGIKEKNCIDSNDANLQGANDFAILHDQSMEITKAITSLLPEGERRVEESPKHAENHSYARENCLADSLTNYRSTSEGKTIVFHDASMELTDAVEFSLQTIDDNSRNREKRECESKNLGEIEKVCGTMIFHDDSMEFTQVQSSSKSKAIPVRDKENCPVVMEDYPREEVPCRARQSQKENILETLESQFIKKIASVKFPSLRENEENLENTLETMERKSVYDCISQDISGVSPFDYGTKTFDFNQRDVHNLENPSEIVTSRNEEMELSQIDQRPEQTENNSLDQRTNDPSSKSSNKSLPNFTLSHENIENNVSKVTNVETRNFLKNTKVPNTTGFDEETFLLERALCLKSHEADSMASQESSLRRLTVIEDQPITIDVGRQKLSTETVEFLSGRKLVEINDETISTRFSRNIERTEPDKSLEELRARASSVIRFCPEDTGYELTEKINRVVPLDFHRFAMSEDLQTEEPPSFGFAYSITEDSVSSANVSLTQPEVSPNEESIKTVDIPEEATSFRVSQFEEKKSLPSPVLIPELPEITGTLVRQMGSCNDVTKDASSMERTLRKEMHRSQRRSDVSVPEIDLSSGENNRTITDRLNKHSLSKIGLSTASTFSSETIDGPSVKLRRGDFDLTKEESNENEKRSVIINDPWSNRYFANSTVIGNDLEQGSTRNDIDNNFLPVKNSFIDELPSLIVSGQNIEDSGLDEAMERIDDITRNLEISERKSSFHALKEIIENLSKRFDVIWDINRLDENIVAFNFFSKSIVLAIYLENESGSSETNGIKDVVLLSQLVKEKTDPGLCLAHDLIMKKMDNAFLKRSCQIYEEIPELLEHVSSRVKLGMDFAFELDRLRNHNVMEIEENRITFVARARDINVGIILNVTIIIKPFEEIDHNDITVSYLLGGEKIRKNYIERLITNVKRDHRFLRFYMADVKDYIDLMAETSSTKR